MIWREARAAGYQPEDTGVTWRSHLMASIKTQCDAWLKSLPKDYEPPLNRKRIWAPHDSYGAKSRLGNIATLDRQVEREQ